MASLAKKFCIIVLFGLMGVFIWYGAVPYIKSLMTQTLAQRVDLELNSSNSQPVSVKAGDTVIKLELVDNEYDRAKGLGGKASLGDDRGMLFVFDKPQFPAMWMKDMQFPIDIAWLNEDFEIVDMKKDVSPATYPSSFSPDLPARYVLEVNSGFLEAHKLVVGSKLELHGN